MVELLVNSSKFKPPVEGLDTISVLVNFFEELVELGLVHVDLVLVEHGEHFVLVEFVW